ncbi:LiaI-LiaF-like domain-containing protein [Emticicia sp. BO119]|uniref:LiaI-LiaF-like domain-containing protein n=1 Tax=Emticicia sp. BO119 TaxID=2757768 RepID=UPI0015F0A0C4|nr:DUF5668 domain-containing protein [Emticicia sp. BO119]MBA4849864.1 hypothetical protein [Emticicia sp. BO119]
MEKRSSNIFWGAILIVVGFLFLGTNLDWFDLHWTFGGIARFWPLLLILAGVFAFLNRRRTIYNATSALLIAFAIPLGIFTCVDDGVSDWRDGHDWHVDFDDDDDDDDDYNHRSVNPDSSSSDGYKNYYSVPLTDGITETKLKIGGGAAEFDLEESPTNLFEASTHLQYRSGYVLTEDQSNGIKTIEFEQKGKKGNFHFDSDHNFDNDVIIKLNKTPVWDIDMGIGAGEVDFDFSDYKVKKLNMNSGAADIDIKLGDKVDNVDVDINSGVTSVKLSVPESVGCELKMDGALNSKDLDGFEKVRGGVWQTPGYDKASKKIKVDADAGLSSIKIVRY